MDAAELVRLNVGGCRYVTTRTTIFSRGENMLTAMLARDDDGTVRTARDEKGFIFIDRNGTTFAIILDLLRTGKLLVPKNIDLGTVREELKYFQCLEPTSEKKQPSSERDRMLLFARAVSRGALHEPDIEAVAANLFGIMLKTIIESRGSTVLLAKRVLHAYPDQPELFPLQSSFHCGQDHAVGPCSLSEGDLRDLAEKVGRVASEFHLRAELIVERGVSVSGGSVSQGLRQTAPISGQTVRFKSEHFLWAVAEIVVRDDLPVTTEELIDCS